MKSTKRSIFLAALLCSVGVYALPYFLTLGKTGWGPLPPVLVSDQMLYLNLSGIHYVSATEVVNPWYGNVVSVVDVPHLMFPGTFLLFRFTHAIFGSWMGAMLVWSAVWTALTFASAVFCLESIFPDTDRMLTVIGAFGLLVLQSPLVYLAEIRHLATAHRVALLELPYLRFAVPQVIVPVVLVYCGLLVRALKNPASRTLAGMALCQFAVFAAFPYMLPLVAIGTGITVLIAKCHQKEITLSWSAVLVFAAVCGVMDIGYLVFAGFFKSHANVHFALHFRPERILPALRPFVILLVSASVLSLFSRASLAARATVAGFALSNALLGFSDVFVAPEAQMLDHPFYIIALTTWLPLFVFLWAFMERFDSRALRTALISGLLLLGAWEGFSSYRSMISINLFQTAAVDELRKLDLTAEDLVVAPAAFSDDVSSWVPLLSPARVLYTPDGENILSAADTRTQQTLRQAVYLMMGGMNLTSLTSITTAGSADHPFGALLQQGDRTYQRSPLEKDRSWIRQVVRERLAPLVWQLDANPALASTVFDGYKRVIVIDNSSKPFFEASALSRWLEIEKTYASNGTNVWICHGKGESIRIP